MIEPTVLRGFSDEYGSWKTICISRWRALRSPSCARRCPRPRTGSPRGRVEQPDQQAGGGALAAAGLADDPERLALDHVEGHAVDGLDRADLPLEHDPRVIGKCLERGPGPGPAARRWRSRRPVLGRARCAVRAVGCWSSSMHRWRSVAGLALREAAPDAAPQSGRQQARDLVVRSRRHGSSRGSIRLWSSWTYGQRGWKWHPDGRLIRLGGRPEIGTSSSSRAVEPRDRLQQAPRVRVLRRVKIARWARARRSARRT